MLGVEPLDRWLHQVVELCQPDHIDLFTGSPEQLSALKASMVDAGIIDPLTGHGCWLHRSDPTDVARMEHRTFICSQKEQDAGPTNHWLNPDSAKATLNTLFSGSFVGRRMYVIPYAMAPLGGAFTQFGVEITDSPYVALSMSVMTRTGESILNAIQHADPTDVVRGLHCTGNLDPENRWVCHFPETREIWSFGSNYGGNALLGKKCHALRLASVIARDSGWLAEHMLIIELTTPTGEIQHIAAAFPSACGKTNLAMLESSLDGWSIRVLGDDIAWLRPGPDGLYAVNPENGFFGVAPGTSAKTNPVALSMTEKDTVFTNVAVTEDGNPWWEGLEPYPNGTPVIDWRGRVRSFGDGEGPMAHPNSRFTSPLTNCKTLSDNWNNPDGVRIDAILFGGRRPTTIPLVMEAQDWTQGVLYGASMASQTTAAATGAVGVLRRDPMAMLPFCGYNICDYFGHWLRMGDVVSNRPKIFSVNWFRQDDAGRYIWPGFGSNIHAIKWISERISESVDVCKTPVGNVPLRVDMGLEGVDVSEEAITQLLTVDADAWHDEVDAVGEYFTSLGTNVPTALHERLASIKTAFSTP
ncbi:MAG: phosphoenolpyruvate carboxykinase (GTP) [Armatimonadaceae bacterium]